MISFTGTNVAEASDFRRYAIVLSMLGLILTIIALVQAIRRLIDMRGDYLAAKAITNPNRLEQLEVVVTHNLCIAQRLRVLSYFGVFVVFLTPMVVQMGELSRFIRTIAALVVLMFFAIEETYKDRARDRWIELARTNGHPTTGEVT